MADTFDGQRSKKDIVADIQKAETLSELGAPLVTIQNRLGFSLSKIYKAKPDPAAPLRDQLSLYNMPESLLDRFDSSGIRSRVPASLFDSNKTISFQWSTDEIVEDLMPEQQVMLRQLLADFHIDRGVYFSMHSIEGPNRAIAFYGERGPLSAAELEDLGYLSIQLLHRFTMLEKRAALQSAGISALEIQCIELAASGLETNEIARRLSFSARTVNYLTNSLCRKLDVDTLEQAVCKALSLGYIDGSPE